MIQLLAWKFVTSVKRGETCTQRKARENWETTRKLKRNWFGFAPDWPKQQRALR